MKRQRVTVTGRVQGVAFRDWTQRTARALGLSGFVRNRRDGSVEAVFVGPDKAVADMIERCRSGPAAARVDSVTLDRADDDGTDFGEFEIAPTV